MTQMTVQPLEDDHSVRFSGNMTMQWKGVEPGDTISFLFQLMDFDEYTQSWKPSIFKADSKNICPEVFSKNKYWYQYFTKHITNKDEVEDKCISVHGLLIQYETFEILLKGNLGFVPNLTGTKKVIILFEAFDKNLQKRPYSFCTQVVGEVRQL
ncbi:uncharacterized protein LOC6640361 [Drosophila willistoni]|nr:uncharacterized protein LOC6640361 [Drosophila willistoni]